MTNVKSPDNRTRAHNMTNKLRDMFVDASYRASDIGVTQDAIGSLQKAYKLICALKKGVTGRKTTELKAALEKQVSLLKNHLVQLEVDKQEFLSDPRVIMAVAYIAKEKLAGKAPEPTKDWKLTDQSQDYILLKLPELIVNVSIHAAIQIPNGEPLEQSFLLPKNIPEE
jgi:hypothetical protein